MKNNSAKLYFYALGLRDKRLGGPMDRRAIKSNRSNWPGWGKDFYFAGYRGWILRY